VIAVRWATIEGKSPRRPYGSVRLDQARHEAQRAMAERNTGLPEDRRVGYRIGINVGDIVVEDEDILGDGVNVAARLEALAPPAGICLSGNVRDELAGKLDIACEDLAS
jgi:adenylate cyclase